MPTNAAPFLRIATRGSRLALAQAEETRARLSAAHGVPETAMPLVVLTTSGDRIQDRPLSEVGGKGLFTKEIEEALLEGTADIAVHSMKDMPTVLPAGLGIVALLPREDPRDAFLAAAAAGLAALPAGARVGTSSLRRAAQLANRRPDLIIVPFRGNVETRLRKLADGVADATLLAMAGLNRLGLADRVTEALSRDDFLPAVAQGAIGIEARLNDSRALGLLEALNDSATAIALSAERALLARLDGSCRTPIAGHAMLSGNRLSLRAEILTPDGRIRLETAREGLQADAARLGDDAGAELAGRAGPGFFAAA